MFVYGVHCSPQELLSGVLPENLTADYYADWQLLVFPAYTRPTALRSHTRYLSTEFWHRVRLLLQEPNRVRQVEAVEDPWLAEPESAACDILGRASAWYYVPLTATATATATATTTASESTHATPQQWAVAPAHA